MKQHVSELTRPYSKAALDFIFTTMDTNIHDMCQQMFWIFGSFHHKLQFTNSISGSINKSQPSKRDYYKAKRNIFSKVLCDSDWKSIFAPENIVIIWQQFKLLSKLH